MTIQVMRGSSDAVIEQIIGALRLYAADHPGSQIDLYRQNSVSVRVRIIDPEFAGRSKVDRSNDVWKHLGALPDEVESEISTLILLTPEEKQKSFANIEFEDPVPSTL
jgi:stress-induced morphogen